MTAVDDSQTATASVQSVDRALTILELLARDGEAGVTDIAAELGVHKSTVSRLITVLESRGYVEQTSERGKYRLGFAISRLARAGSGHLDLVGRGATVPVVVHVHHGHAAVPLRQRGEPVFGRADVRIGRYEDLDARAEVVVG